MVRVLTVKDVPGRNMFGTIGPFIDQPVFAQNNVRFRGEAVAAVIAEPETAWQLDLKDFPVTWEPRPALTAPEEASATTDLLHDHRPGNLLTTGLVHKGDSTRRSSAKRATSRSATSSRASLPPTEPSRSPPGR